MPAQRVTNITQTTQSTKSKPYARTTTDTAGKPALPDSTLAFPTGLDRIRFRKLDGKAPTAHQWKVYDWILTIPVGKVTTYGLLAKALNSSPRAVGGALRDNPFHPYVPCHRIIASTLFIGGFQGEWGKQDVTTEKGKVESDKLAKKLRLLESEGVHFDGKGKLIGGEEMLWSGL